MSEAAKSPAGTGGVAVKGSVSASSGGRRTSVSSGKRRGSAVTLTMPDLNAEAEAEEVVWHKKLDRWGLREFVTDPNSW